MELRRSGRPFLDSKLTEKALTGDSNSDGSEVTAASYSLTAYGIAV